MKKITLAVILFIWNASYASAASDALKIHCRLSGLNQNASEDFDIIGESMSWVTDEVLIKDSLGNFSVMFLLKNSYLKIGLTNPQDQMVIDINQYVGHSIDFESKIPFKTIIEGKSYDTLSLMCEEALGKTFKKN